MPVLHRSPRRPAVSLPSNRLSSCRDPFGLCRWRLEMLEDLPVFLGDELGIKTVRCR